MLGSRRRLTAPETPRGNVRSVGRSSLPPQGLSYQLQVQLNTIEETNHRKRRDCLCWPFNNALANMHLLRSADRISHLCRRHPKRFRPTGHRLARPMLYFCTHLPNAPRLLCMMLGIRTHVGYR